MARGRRAAQGEDSQGRGLIRNNDNLNLAAAAAAADVPVIGAPPVGNPVQNFERDGQRRRLSNQPYDLNLNMTSPIFSGVYDEVTLPTLTTEDVLARVCLRRKYMDGQILRIILPLPAQSNAQIMHRMRRQQGNRFMEVTYHRIYLCRVFSDRFERHNSKLFYLLQNKTINTRLWELNPEFRDNGTIAVGTFIRIANPDPVEKFMQGIPMVTTNLAAYPLKDPRVYDSIPINRNLPANAAMCAVFNGCRVNINSFAVVSWMCAGLHCQRHDILTENRVKCGCFSSSPFRSNLVFLFGLAFQLGNGDWRTMTNFSDLSFQKSFFNAPIPSEVTAGSLQGTTLGIAVEDAIYRKNQFVNSNGGYTGVVWVKRGVINDASLIGANGGGANNNNEDTRIVANDVNIHVVKLMPTDTRLLDCGTPIGAQYRALNFNVLDLINGIP